MIFLTVSTGHFDPLVARCSELSHRYEFLGQIGCSVTEPKFPHYRTGPPSKIESDMAAAEIVIAHAGTGMLSSLYRLKKKAVVVPKQIRYGEANDGQVELAVKWASLGLGVLCLDIQDLEAAIEECRKRPLHFSRQPSLGTYLQTQLQNTLSLTHA